MTLFYIFVCNFKVLFSRSQKYGIESYSLCKQEFHMQKWNMRFHLHFYNNSFLAKNISFSIRVQLGCDGDVTLIINLMQGKYLNQFLIISLKKSFPRTDWSLQSLSLAQPAIDIDPVISSSHSRTECWIHLQSSGLI